MYRRYAIVFDNSPFVQRAIVSHLGFKFYNYNCVITNHIHVKVMEHF